MKLIARLKEDPYERNVFLSELFEVLLIVGLLVEFIFVFVLDKPVLEKVEMAISDALIFGGVAGAFHFGRKARGIGETAQAEANARASEAQLALEHLRSETGPRILDKEAFIKAMNSSPSSPSSRARVFISDDANDGIFAAMSISEALRELGWEVVDEIHTLPSRAAGGWRGRGIDIRAPSLDTSMEGFPSSPAGALSIALNGAIPGQIGVGLDREVPNGEVWITIFER